VVGHIGVLESNINDVVVRLKIHIGEFEERVKNYFAIINEFKEEDCKLAYEKLKIEISYKSLCTKHRKLQERVSKLMEAGYRTFDEFRCFWWWKQ
jgi:chromosome segregation ATPase